MSVCFIYMSVSRNRTDLQLSGLSFPWVKLQPQADLRVTGCRGYRGSEDASGGRLRWRRSDWSLFASSDRWEARPRGSSPECRRCGSGFRCSGALPASALWRDPIAALSHCVAMVGTRLLINTVTNSYFTYKCSRITDVEHYLTLSDFLRWRANGSDFDQWRTFEHSYAFEIVAWFLFDIFRPWTLPRSPARRRDFLVRRLACENFFIQKWRRKEAWNTTCCEVISPRTKKEIGFRSLTRALSNPMIGSGGLNCGKSF